MNVCLEWKRSRKTTASLDEVPQTTSGDPPVDQTATAHILALQALGILSPSQRAVILLKEREGWTTDEIATAMGWKTKKVENELYRARLALARWRAQQGSD